MRKTIMLGSFVALLGLGTAGLAIAQTNPPPSDTVQVQDTSKEAGGDRPDRPDRREAKEHAGDRRDDAKEPRPESRKGRDETRERHERR
jgi:hypothetical protein